ncbi:hypothetical protein ACIGZJ_24650 [Kitasatospora sp. NPDC052868]|uniref:hypothetical protein n=1 Tax=Kitasatospora sp. NPDC052868 TaxID=3364060 RepID=UPI0037CB6E14
MRNGLVQLGAWAAATGAAVALSWLGVHTVLTGAAFEQPTALPLPSPASTGTRPSPSASTAQPPATPSAQAQASPQSAPTAAPPSSASPAGQRTPSPPAAQTSSRRPVPATATTTSSIQSYLVPGGKVALDIRPDNASLVSATPDPGWKMETWKGDQWMRIDFTKGDQANSVFVAWNGHPPDVTTAVR